MHTANLEGFGNLQGIPQEKWMNFFTKVLTKFVKQGMFTLNVSFEAARGRRYRPAG